MPESSDGFSEPSIHAPKGTSIFLGSCSTSLIGSALEYGDHASTAIVTPAAAASHGLKVTSRRRAPARGADRANGIGPDACIAHHALPAASILALSGKGIA